MTSLEEKEVYETAKKKVDERITESRKFRKQNQKIISEMCSDPEGYVFRCAQIFTPWKAYITVSHKWELEEYLLQTVTSNRLDNLETINGTCENCDTLFVFIGAPQEFSIPTLACIIYDYAPDKK